MYPLDFEEFCLALGKEQLYDYIQLCFAEKKALERTLHNEAMLFFYTHYDEAKHRNDMEIDFLLSNSSKLSPKLFPVEVKSGRNYTTASLGRFHEKFRERIGEAYIIHPRNLAEKDGVLCIPPYMATCL